MIERLKRAVMFILDPPWTKKDTPENFTLAVSQAHTTFKRGDVGWANRPPAVVNCPSCETPFTHEFANDFIDCPHCYFERSPDHFEELDLVGLVCPHCQDELDRGIRHPELLDIPEWASCTNCQYHWEYQHDYTG